ncbi:MAG: hypothetical protein WCH44_11715 [Betaproteobacteria bacterium]
MHLWTQWLQAVYVLRPACRRARIFVWMVLVLVGMCCRADNAGVTSFVRVLNFGDQAYHRFLHLFHSTGLDLDLLTSSWGINWGQTPITPITPITLDAATVAIGVYAASAEMSISGILSVQNFVARNSVYAPGTVMDSTYTHLPARNITNTQVGYDLVKSGRYP